MKRKAGRLLAAFLALTLVTAALPAMAGVSSVPGSGYYTVYDEAGQVLFTWDGEVQPGDGYISRDNLRYEIRTVNAQTRRAQAACCGPQPMPEVFAAAEGAVSAGKQQPNKRIAIYFTHTDEAYEPSEGTESVESGGGIVEVGNAFADALRRQGLQVTVDETNHVPHDAGAYRRSRRTAVDLLETVAPAAIFDIHRDGVPAEEYLLDLEGQPAARVRIVIGAGNQNADANEELALRIKAVADEIAPGLIKDIYTGKGAYNQDLAPNAILFEMGTYSHRQERAEVSAGHLAEAVTLAMYGGTVAESPAPSQTPGQQGEAQPPSAAPQPSATPLLQVKGAQDKGGGKGWLWLIAAAVVGGGAWVVITSEKGFGRGVKEGARELWGGVTGKKRDKK